MASSVEKRVGPEAGIAIGPILFIIAILGILAAAIAAGSGTFMGSKTAESNKTKSSALIQIGENLKLGMDQITMEVGIPPNNVNMDYAATGTNTGLFSPTGGGIARPSPGMANDPSHDEWFYLRGDVTGFGTGHNVVMALLPVAQGVCSEVNNRVMGTAGFPTFNTIGNFADGTGTNLSGTWPEEGNWTDAAGNTVDGPSLQGIATGCVQNEDVTANTTDGPATTNYFFYQVLAIQ
ncbi:MAG: hypothetical protein PHE27_03225 [Alphaproteobacteria bacterium]|nr:hypothetical protein [Alphaproteobacteria bacterium]